MALVKKLQPGGTITSDDKFDKFLEEQGRSVKKNSYQTYAGEAELLRNIYRTKGLKGLHDAFEFDNLKNTYIPKDPTLVNFTGLAEGKSVNNDIFGRIKLESPEAARTYLGSIVQKFIQSNPLPKEEKKVYKPLDLATEITNRKFGENAENFAGTYFNASEDDRWNKYIIPTLKESIKAYKESDPQYEHKYLTELNQIGELLNNPNIDRNKIIDLLNSTGQDTRSLFRTKEELDQLSELEKQKAKQKQIQINQEEEDANRLNFNKVLEKLGFDGSELYDRGYTKIEQNSSWTKNPWLAKYLEENPNVKALRNISGKHILIDEKGLHDREFNDLSQPQYYGKAIKNILDGSNAGVYADNVTNLYKSNILQKPQNLLDYESGKIVPRSTDVENPMPLGYTFKFSGNAPKEFVNAVIHGFPSDVKDGKIIDNVINPFGQTDYTRSLKLTLPGNKTIWLRRNQDNSYRDDSGKIYNFGLKVGSPIPYKNSISTGYRSNLTRELSTTEVKRLYMTGRYTEGDKASMLNWAIKNPSDPLSKSIISNFKKKDGGKIEKFQFGGIQRYVDAPKVKVVENSSPNLKGSRFSDNSKSGKMNKAILAANAASVIPGGVGALGGLASTALEGYRDFSDGVDASDFGNLALNLGLTAASFFGIGAPARMLLKSGKAGKAVKAATIASKYNDVEKLANVASKVEGGDKYIDAINTLKKAGITNLSKGTELVGDEKKAFDLVSNLASSLTKNNTLKPITSSIAKGVSTKPLQALVKTSNKLAIPLGITSTVQGLSTLSTDTWDKIKEGDINSITTADAEALFNAAFGLRVTGRKAKMLLAKKYGTLPGEEVKASLETMIKDKKITVTGDPVNKFNSKNFLKSKSNKKAVKEAILKEYNKDLKPEEKLKIEDLKDIDINRTKASTSGLKLKEANNIDQNQTLQDKARKWAERYDVVSKYEPGGTITPSSTKRGGLKIPYEKIGKGISSTLSKNSGLIGDIAMFGITDKMNRQNASLQKKALSNLLMPSMVLPKVMLNMSNPMLNEYSNAATTSRNLGKRIADSTSDLKTGINAKLESEKNASNILLQGSKANADYTQGMRDKQVAVNADINAKNLQSAYQTMASNKDIAKEITRVDVNKNIMDAQRFYNLNDALQATINKNKHFAQLDKIMAMYKDPEYLNKVKQYQDLKTIINSGDYSSLPEYQAWKNSSQYDSSKQDGFIKSSNFNSIKDTLNELEKYLKDYKEGISVMQYKYQMGNYAKGGTIEDRISVEREKSKGKKELEILRQYYKRLLKNEEFLQKSMIKIRK